MDVSVVDPPAPSIPSGGVSDTLYRVLERFGLATRVEPGSSPHISCVPGTTVPLAFAWFGPDVPREPPSVVGTNYAALTGAPQAATWDGPSFYAACDNAQRFFLRGAPPIVPCPPILLPFWGLPSSPSLQDAAALRASALHPHLAVLWHDGPSGPLLATDAVGAPVTASTVASLADTYECLAVPLDLPARHRLDALVGAADLRHPYWHVSPVPQARAPLAFAWFGPDGPAGPAPTLLDRAGRPVVWAGASADDAVERGVAALGASRIPAVAARCPATIRSLDLPDPSAPRHSPLSLDRAP